MKKLGIQLKGRTSAWLWVKSLVLKTHVHTHMHSNVFRLVIQLHGKALTQCSVYTISFWVFLGLDEFQTRDDNTITNGHTIENWLKDRSGALGILRFTVLCFKRLEGEENQRLALWLQKATGATTWLSSPCQSVEHAPLESQPVPVFLREHSPRAVRSFKGTGSPCTISFYSLVSLMSPIKLEKRL